MGYALSLIAREQSGKSFPVMPKAMKLVTHGLYSRIRNSIYASVDIRLAGVILVLHWPWLFVVLFVIIACQAWQARREARVLEQTFGQEYRSYRQRRCF